MTSEDNERAANQIAEIVRNLTQDNELADSCLGRRWTQDDGLYLQAAMQLFGRDPNRMSHLLVNHENEGQSEKVFLPNSNP